MRRIFLGISIAALGCSFGFAATPEHPGAYDEFIARQAANHGVPERLVHRVVMRESRYNPRLVHNHCFGMMQIKYGTARSMGYKGAPQGLLDPHINMTYAIPYLANAYRIADGDEDRAVRLFAGGYYYAAKQKQLLASLRTADSPPLTPQPPAPPRAAQNPALGLFAFLQGPPTEPAPQVSATPAAAEPAAPTAAAYSPAGWTPAAAAPICNPALASLAQDGAEPSPTTQTTSESAAPPPDVRAKKSHKKSAAKSGAAKVAQEQAVEASAALASVEPSAQPLDAARVTTEPSPKPEAAKAQVKSVVAANEQSGTAATDETQAKAAEPALQVAEMAKQLAPPAHAGKAKSASTTAASRVTHKSADLAAASADLSDTSTSAAKSSHAPTQKAKAAKAHARSITLAAAKNAALAVSGAGPRSQPNMTDGAQQ